MITRIIDFSVENKFFVFALAAVACIAGWWSMRHLPLDAIPDLSDTQVIASRAGTAARTPSKTR